MNTWIILLGMIQGVTEFLPISSSGHLVLFQTIFDFKEMLFYDILLHFATLLTVVILFFKDIIEYFKNSKIIFYIFLLTIPTGIIGLFVKKYLSFIYDNVLLSGIFLFITGIWLVLSEKRYLNNTSLKLEINNIGIIKTILIGVAQGVAVLPGISRSAATLGSMLMFNIDKEQSVKFVFIAGIPAILAATFLELKDVISNNILRFQNEYFYGLVVAFLFGLLSLKFLIRIVKKQKLKLFAYYCWIIGFISIITYFIKNNF